MKTISEVGHSKNVANLEDLISYCTAFGVTYNPSLAALQLGSLTTLKTTADAAITATVNAVTNYKTAVSNRQIAFKNLRQLAPRIISALKASGTSPQTLANANAIYKKLMGRTKKVSTSTLPKIGDGATTIAVTISTSQQSYDSRIEFFTALIDLVSNVSSYSPNETNLTVASLNSFLTNLKTVNTAVITTTTTLDTARSFRNSILYNAATGLVIIAREVKNYVASIYGKGSTEFKNVNKIKFKVFKY